MSDPKDRDFGKYQKTRYQSGVVYAYDEFKFAADYRRSITDPPNPAVLQDLRTAVQRFKSLKEKRDVAADAAGKIADDFLKHFK